MPKSKKLTNDNKYMILSKDELLPDRKYLYISFIDKYLDIDNFTSIIIDKSLKYLQNKIEKIQKQ